MNRDGFLELEEKTLRKAPADSELRMLRFLQLISWKSRGQMVYSASAQDHGLRAEWGTYTTGDFRKE